jgi:hypothetical protein
LSYRAERGFVQHRLDEGALPLLDRVRERREAGDFQVGGLLGAGSGHGRFPFVGLWDGNAVLTAKTGHEIDRLDSLAKSRRPPECVLSA